MKKMISRIKEMNKKNTVVFAGYLLCFVLIIVSYLLGANSAANKEMVAKKLSRDDEYSRTVKELQEASDKLQNTKDEIKQQEDLVAELNDYKASREQKTKEITSLDADINNKTTTVSTLDNDIAAKSAELDSLKNAIKTTGEAPKVLPAGQFIAGKDIPAGRYTVTGKGNFVVHSATGRLKVNTILGGGMFEDSYTCYIDAGDELKLSSKDTFTPVQ